MIKQLGSVVALAILLVMPAGAFAQTPTPDPIYRDGPSTLVYPDETWCDLFTDGGTLMEIETCVLRVQLMIGEPSARRVPQSLVPKDPTPQARRVTRKGKQSGDTRSFAMAAGSYRAAVKTKNCARELYTALRPRGSRAPGQDFSDGAYLYDVEEGEYTIEVVAVPKANKTCNWSIRLTPIRE